MAVSTCVLLIIAALNATRDPAEYTQSYTAEDQTYNPTTCACECTHPRFACVSTMAASHDTRMSGPDFWIGMFITNVILA